MHRSLIPVKAKCVLGQVSLRQVSFSQKKCFWDASDSPSSYSPNKFKKITCTLRFTACAAKPQPGSGEKCHSNFPMVLWILLAVVLLLALIRVFVRFLSIFWLGFLPLISFLAGWGRPLLLSELSPSALVLGHLIKINSKIHIKMTNLKN